MYKPMSFQEMAKMLAKKSNIHNADGNEYGIADFSHFLSLASECCATNPSFEEGFDTQVDRKRSRSVR